MNSLIRFKIELKLHNSIPRQLRGVALVDKRKLIPEAEMDYV